MEEKLINEKESLELISRMIRNTQNRLEGDEGIPFLTWGYTTVAVTIAYAILFFFLEGSYWWNLIWFAIPMIGWPATLLFMKKNKEKEVSTYVDRIIGYVWMVLGIACFVASAVCILFGNLFVNILFIVVLLMSSGVALTGLIIKFKPLTISGIIGMVIAFFSVIISRYCPLDNLAPAFQLGMFALAFIVMMIIPGHILNCKANREVSHV